jgi:hypothetical protein
MIVPNWLARAGIATPTFGRLATPTAASLSLSHTTVHVTTHIVMLGLAYEFSGPMPIVAKY